MLFRVQRWRIKLAHKLWLRPALASLFAVMMAILAYWLGHNYEGKVALEIDESSLVSLLSIFASSMLSVATFTVSAIVAAASSVSNSTTYRASQYILGDKKAQLVLSSFIAAFIYSIVGILSLKAFHYGAFGRFILFLGLLVIVSFVLLAFINWVDHAMKLGRQDTILATLTDIALDSITPATVQQWGAAPWDGQIPADSVPVYPANYGYVVGLDVANLQARAEEAKARFIIATRIGQMTDVSAPIAYLSPAQAITEGIIEEVRDAIAISSKREAAEDIRYNLLNLTEAADRALSSAINDAGTAINVLNLQLKVIAKWVKVRQDTQNEALQYPYLSVLPLTAQDLIQDNFNPIARDGAAVVEVGLRLQKVLLALARLNQPDLTVAAKQMSQLALELGEHALVARLHREQVVAAALQVQQVN